MSSFLPKDFIETNEGLIFAVVSASIEEQRILSFLRYHRSVSGCKKLSTGEANALLRNRWPEYLYYSKVRDVPLHAVPLDKITHHHQPNQRLMMLWRNQTSDGIEKKLKLLLKHFNERGLSHQDMGVTGSMLIGKQNPDSDIDLVFYQRGVFFKAKEIIKQLLSEGLLQYLDDALWHDAYERRGCSLNFEEFLWHERRKYNKAAMLQTKIDISLVASDQRSDKFRYKKHGKFFLKTQISDDTYNYDYPARYGLEHPSIGEAVSYTATYIGQAFEGETVEIQGQLEISDEGHQRILIGTDREASDEYIKVWSPKKHTTENRTDLFFKYRVPSSRN